MSVPRRSHPAFRLVCILALAGCVGAPPAQTLDIIYTDAEFSSYVGGGDGAIVGQAFLRQQGGGVVVCAGEPVVLIPRTASFEKAVELARQGIQPMPSTAGDERFARVARMATCDAQGNFAFENLPRAKWYIFSRVVWSVADYPQGGDLLGEVDTTEGGEQRILLSDRNKLG